MMGTGRIVADPSVKWAEFRLIHALDRLRLALKAYDPDQPRAPGGTEEGGQWIAVDDGSLTLAGGFKPEHLDMTVRDFFSQMCKADARGAMPGQFWGMSVRELLEAEARGVPLAHRCYKILNEDRFRKPGKY